MISYSGTSIFASLETSQKEKCTGEKFETSQYELKQFMLRSIHL